MAAFIECNSGIDLEDLIPAVVNIERHIAYPPDTAVSLREIFLVITSGETIHYPHVSMAHESWLGVPLAALRAAGPSHPNGLGLDIWMTSFISNNDTCSSVYDGCCFSPYDMLDRP